MMIRMHCKDVHKPDNILCEECSTLLKYAQERINQCRFGPTKPVCGKCKIHCYRPDMRGRIRTVMRNTGAKLILKHPLLAVFHLVDNFKYKNKP
jgi:hypothetical protein